VSTAVLPAQMGEELVSELIVGLLLTVRVAEALVDVPQLLVAMNV